MTRLPLSRSRICRIPSSASVKRVPEPHLAKLQSAGNKNWGIQMAKKSLPLSKVYSLLEPGPVVLVTTVLRGRVNVMPMSWHTMIEVEPPIVVVCHSHCPVLTVRD